jgi:hypothetical protein
LGARARGAIRDGRSSVMGVHEDATMLVLYKGEREVRRVPLTLAPAELTVVSP